MNSIRIEQEGSGRLELAQDIPEELIKYVLQTATPVSLTGEGFKALFQRMAGKGFAVWYSRYWIRTTTILRATDGQPALELRIALRNRIKGTWDTVRQPELLAYYYQFSFVPYVVTRAVFDGGMDYETFDIHFDISFLEDIGIDYKAFERFIGQVLKEEPADLSPEPRRLPPLMSEAVQAILYNSYSPAGKAWLLQNNVENILLASHP